MRTSQASRPFSSLCFFSREKNKKRRREREMVRTSHANRPFCPPKKPAIYHFFHNLIAKPAAKLSGRLEPIGNFCFLVIFLKEKTTERTRNCEDVSSQTPVFHQTKSNYLSFLDKFESEIVRTSQAKRPFLKRNDRFYDRVRLQNCEDVSSETSVFQFFKQKRNKRDREIVRTSQPKRPF